MKVAHAALALTLGALLLACAGPANGGWVTKHGWDASSRLAPASERVAAEPAPKPEHVESGQRSSPTLTESSSKAKTEPQKEQQNEVDWGY